MSEKSAFPVMKWDPKTGENRIFNAAAEIPEGWLDQHPKDVKGAPDESADVSKGAALPLKKKDIVAQLKAGGIEFNPNDTAAALYALLDAKLREHLASLNIEAPADADVTALLALVPAA